ncbi:MAG TPA: molybdopterin-binding/glycosyltransferase family 2 protein [Alphaproteobacteria bacterium]|nr:molybdopterin-binding/glycosyltransferase family 2 protein [Alphaproteobacteria bacterium]
MKFGEIPVADAVGAILAHSHRVAAGTLKKGRLLSAEDIAALQAAGIRAVIAARLEPDDVGEDAAAAAISRALAGDHLVVSAAFTGRANLYAARHGLAVIDAERVERLNLVDEAITVATLAPYTLVEPRQMVATIKVIPFAAPAASVEKCVSLGASAVRIAPFARKAVGLIQTRLASVKPSVIANTVATTNARIAALGSQLVADAVCDHDQAAIAAQIDSFRARGCDVILVLGASAIVDRRDAIPAAVERAGGEVLHFGMPVDPGNLLLLGRIGAMPVLGLPGCARSPKLNGFDWVLQRLLADLPVSRTDIMRMGVGGLLTEIATRPLPRRTASPEPSAVPRAPKIAAVILAAGRSSRMAPANKLLTEVEGQTMIARAVDAALGSQAGPVFVVTGHDSARVRQALGGQNVTIVENPAFADGLSASVRAGIGALPPDVDGAVFLLGDMPRVTATHIDRLIAAFNPDEGRTICVPTWRAKRGNPVLWSSRFFPEMRALEGDTGARGLIRQHAEQVCEVEMPDDGVLLDVDTPDALAALRADAKASA